MTTPKVNTISRGGSRYYVSPSDGSKVPGVTSIIGMLPKGFLGPWNGKMAAEFAVDNAGSIIQLLLNGQRQAAIDMIKNAAYRFTKNSADEGTAAHDAFETIAKGETLGRLSGVTQVYADHFAEFVAFAKPQILHTEQTVWSEKHNYAGSFDGFGLICPEALGLEGTEPVPTWLDWKTTRSGVHEEVALQLAAYANADYIVHPDGTTSPLPKGDMGAVLHVRPEGWAFTPVYIGPEVFDIFLGLRQKVFEWETGELKKRVIRRPIYTSATVKELTAKAAPLNARQAAEEADVASRVEAAATGAKPSKPVKPSARIAAKRRGVLS